MAMTPEERARMSPIFEELKRRLEENYERTEAPHVRKLFTEHFPCGVEVIQYDENDHITGTFMSFQEIVANNNYKNFYYRYSVYPHSSRVPIHVNHFGIDMQLIGSSKLEEDVFFNTILNSTLRSKNIEDQCGETDLDPFSKPLYYHFMRKKQQLSDLSQEEFNSAFVEFLTNWPLVEIMDLSPLKGVCGIYVMVLDHYKQCYIGKSKDIKKRIKQHWLRDEKANGTNIDTFRAFDTTRIFIIPMESDSYAKHVDWFEEKMISSIATKFLLNIMPGGDIIGNIHEPDSPYIYPTL